jgi:hypothetical protein
MVGTSDSDEVHPMKEDLESVLTYCKDNKRVCPMPQSWVKLYELLPNRRRAGAGWEPPLPLILAAWDDTPALLKMLRLVEHVEWAAQHGAMPQVASFLTQLPEDSWLHLGES